VKSCELQNRLK